MIQKEKKFSDQIKNKLLDGESVIGWGASGNGVQILNKLNLTEKDIPVVIDSDKNKQGLFIPGTNQKIISPQDAKKFNPNTVIIFTQFHKREIEKSCREIFGDISP